MRFIRIRFELKIVYQLECAVTFYGITFAVSRQLNLGPLKVSGRPVKILGPRRCAN